MFDTMTDKDLDKLIQDDKTAEKVLETLKLMNKKQKEANEFLRRTNEENIQHG